MSDKCPITGKKCNKPKPYRITEIKNNASVLSIDLCENCLDAYANNANISLHVNASDIITSTIPPTKNQIQEIQQEVVFEGINEFVNKLLQTLYGQQDEQQTNSAKIKKQSTKKKCPKCGATPSSINKKGQLGCPACYDFFNVDQAIVGLHGGATQHVGKVPSKWKAAKEVQSVENIEKLVENKINQLIALEQYEDIIKIKKVFSDFKVIKESLNTCTQEELPTVVSEFKEIKLMLLKMVS